MSLSIDNLIEESKNVQNNWKGVHPYRRVEELKDILFRVTEVLEDLNDRTQTEPSVHEWCSYAVCSFPQCLTDGVTYPLCAAEDWRRKHDRSIPTVPVSALRALLALRGMTVAEELQAIKQQLAAWCDAAEKEVK